LAAFLYCRETAASTGANEKPRSGQENGWNGPPAKSRLTTRYNEVPMKAYVYVSLKKSVLDPQGKTIHGALKKMGYRGIDELRQGKYFEIALDASVSREDAQAEVDRIAREVLTNPVIEEYTFKLEG